jgi:hypothetical protein
MKWPEDIGMQYRKSKSRSLNPYRQLCTGSSHHALSALLLYDWSFVFIEFYSISIYRIDYNDRTESVTDIY